MHFNWDAGTLSALIPIVALLIPIVAIITGALRWWQGEVLRHETIRSIARSGQPIPPELLRGRPSSSDGDVPLVAAPATPRSAMRAGFILVSVGLGLCAALYLVAPEDWIWGFGLIPLFMGFAFLAIWRFESNPRP